MKIDYPLLSILFLLLFIGFTALVSTSAQLSQENMGDVFYHLKHQVLLGFLPGLVLGIIIFFLDIKLIKKWSLYILIANILFVLLVFVPGLGLKLGGARRWIRVGSFTFQPSELLKLTIPLYLAVWLEKQKDRSFLTLGLFVFIVALVALPTILQPDMSTTVILGVFALLVYFLSDAPLTHVLLLAALAIGACVLLIYISPYRMDRFVSALNPSYRLQSSGYQAKQSRIAIGSGGLWGVGLGLSQQKFGALPNVISDSIFAAWAEETGLIGSVLLITLFLLFLIRAMMVEKKGIAQTLVPALAGGIVFQAFLNIGAMTGPIPLTGVPLPFISYGGSHLLAELMICGLIFNLLNE